MELSGPRWKGKGFSDIAQANPMSEIVSQLRTSLARSKTSAILSGCAAVLEVDAEAAELLERASIGQGFTNFEEDKHWFQLAPEESFYMCYALKCIKILRKDNTPMEYSEVWDHFSSQRGTFPELYKAYSHLRSKNWVVRSGTHYGADFVAYRHHPALVHAEYAVLVIPKKDENGRSFRLSQWSDLCCSLRLSGSVAKILLVLYVTSCGKSGWSSMGCLEELAIEEQVIRRWIPERSREDKRLEADEAHRKVSSISSGGDLVV